MGYRLSSLAERDFIDLIAFGFERFGKTQTEKFAEELKRTFIRIAQFPLANRDRSEMDPSARVQIFQNYLIIYRIEQDGIFILRIVHGHYDWQNEL